MGLIKGHTVVLLQRVEVGTDPFGMPEYEEQRVEIQNVLVEPVSSDDIVEELNLYGATSVYKIHIPKGDTHIWQNQQVEFLGETWTVFSFPLEYYPEDMPLDWDKQYYVERFN